MCSNLPTVFQVTTLWFHTLGDAIYLYKRDRPDEKYLKRMRIHNQPSSKFIKRQKIGFSNKDRKEAQERRMNEVGSVAWCESCNIEMYAESSTASLSCPECANTRSHQVFGSEFREGISIHSPYLYKKQNHFRDWICRSQGTESTSIPDYVMNDIRTELLKRTKDLTKVTPEQIRKTLVTLKQSRYYNHKINIWTRITGQRALQLSNAQEADLTKMFSIILNGWQEIKPSDRSNMFSYSYIIHKFCLLLNEPELASHFK